MEPQVVRMNNNEVEIKRNRCKYNNFTTCQLSIFNGKDVSIEIMDWISEMELAFITYGCNSKLQTTYTILQFRGGLVASVIR